MSIRVLPHEEWDKLSETQLPPLLPFVRPEDIDIVVAEDGGRVVGSLAVLRVTHLEGLWIDHGHEGNPGIGRGLMNAAFALARRTAPGWAIGGAVSDQMRDILGRLGAVKIPMDSYAVKVGG